MNPSLFVAVKGPCSLTVSKQNLAKVLLGAKGSCESDDSVSGAHTS